MDLHLYIDSQTRSLVSGPQSRTPFTFPPLFQGDTVFLILHGQKPSSDPDSLDVYVDTPISFTGIKAGIGFGPDAPAPAGSFKLRLVGGTHVTPPLPFNVTQQAAQDAVNALPEVIALDAQGITLDQVNPVAGNFFLIRWVNTTITAQFEVVVNRLEPLCFVRSFVVALPAGQMQLLKLIVAPLAFTDQFTYPQLAPVTVGSLRAGTGTQNCVQGIIVPPDATGSVAFTFAANSTSIISVSGLNGKTDGSSTIAGALNALYGDGQTRFQVRQQDTGKYYVEFVGPLEKQDFDLLGVTMSDQEPANTPIAQLPLDGVAIELALHGQASVKLVFELEITDGDNVLTAVQVPVVILNDMIDGAMSIVSNPKWQLPAGPEYPPYDPGGATISAPGAYVTPVGSGVGFGTGGTDFVVTHNLGTSNVLVGVRETGGTHHRIPDNQYTCTILNDNQVEVVFPVAPTNGQYFIVIAAVIPAAMALPHHTHPISDIIGLQAILDALTAGGNPLDLWPNIPDSKLPRHIAWNNQDGDKSSRFAVVPDALIGPNILRTPIKDSDLPPGTPYYVAGPPPSVVITIPGTPPQIITILQGSTATNPPKFTLPPDILPDPSDWPGLYEAIIKALQGGSTLPKGFIPISLPLIDKKYPSSVVMRDGTPAVAPSLALAIPSRSDAGNITGAFPPPSIAQKGKVWTVLGSATAAAVPFRAPQRFADGTKVGCDGRQYFPVVTDQVIADDANGAWPAEMEQPLFSFHVTPVMMARNCRLFVNVQMELGMTGPVAVDRRCVTRFMARFGRFTGYPELDQTIFNAPILYETFYLTGASAIHNFQVSVTRSNTDVFTTQAGLYNRLSTVANPPLGDFIVQAFLDHFDVEDRDDVAVGQLHLKVANATASIVDLSQNS